MNKSMIFEKHEVEIIELNGQILFNPRHVGVCLEISESAVRDHIASMSNKQVVKLTNSDVGSTDIRKLNNAGENFLTESGVYKLVFKSRKPEAERFQDWVTDVVLPSIRKTGSFSVMTEKDKTDTELLVLKYAGEMLNMSEASKLGMLQRFMEIKGLDSRALPVYAEKKRVSFSATKLLEDRGKPVSTVAFNKLLILEGFLEERERKSVGSTVKKFKMLTEKGLQFGENLVSPKNEKEVQPYYFEDSFDELLRIIDGTGEEE